MYLLDTNICIYCIKNKPESVLEQLNLKRKYDVYISSITVAELEFGVEKSKYPERNRIALIEFLSIFKLLPFDDKDAQEYGKIKAKLSKDGNIIGPLDILIGSQAKSKNLILVTNNVKEFERIDELEIENWVDWCNCT
ncbi:tRNA(fMet)-specific endonuclease VapC [subsurface metagenome]